MQINNSIQQKIEFANAKVYPFAMFISCGWNFLRRSQKTTVQMFGLCGACVRKRCKSWPELYFHQVLHTNWNTTSLPSAINTCERPIPTKWLRVWRCPKMRFSLCWGYSEEWERFSHKVNVESSATDNRSRWGYSEPNRTHRTNTHNLPFSSERCRLFCKRRLYLYRLHHSIFELLRHCRCSKSSLPANKSRIFNSP